MPKVFDKLVLTEEDDMVVSLCLIIIALATAAINTKLLDKEVTYGAHHGIYCSGRGTMTVCLKAIFILCTPTCRNG